MRPTAGSAKNRGPNESDPTRDKTQIARPPCRCSFDVHDRERGEKRDGKVRQRRVVNDLRLHERKDHYHDDQQQDHPESEIAQCRRVLCSPAESRDRKHGGGKASQCEHDEVEIPRASVAGHARAEELELTRNEGADEIAAARACSRLATATYHGAATMPATAIQTSIGTIGSSRREAEAGGGQHVPASPPRTPSTSDPAAVIRRAPWSVQPVRCRRRRQ